MHLHLSSFVWNAAQTTSWSGLSDRIYIRLECVSEGIYTWSFQDRIAIRSKEMHEVTRCKRPHIDKDRITDRQKEWYRDRQTDRQIGNGSVMSRDVTIHSTHDSIWFTILITWYNYFLNKMRFMTNYKWKGVLLIAWTKAAHFFVKLKYFK